MNGYRIDSIQSGRAVTLPCRFLTLGAAIQQAQDNATRIARVGYRSITGYAVVNPDGTVHTTVVVPHQARKC